MTGVKFSRNKRYAGKAHFDCTLPNYNHAVETFGDVFFQSKTEIISDIYIYLSGQNSYHCTIY